MLKQCGICKRSLDNPDDPLSKDCGGDCVDCMAEAGDPDAVIARLALALQKAVGVYQYASMTAWEREACADDMKFAEHVLDRSTEYL